MKKRLFSIVVGLLVLSSWPSFAEDNWPSWPQVQIPDEETPQEVVRLKTLWRLDCGVDSEIVIGQIESVAPGLDGRILLLDRQLVQVIVVSPAGDIERVFGQHGEGPGDLPGAYRGFQLLDGRIGVSGGGPPFSFQVGSTGRIALFDLEDQPAGNWQGAGDPGTLPVCSIRELRCSPEHILVASQGTKFRKPSSVILQELAIYSVAENQRLVIARRELVQEWNDLTINEAEYFETFAYGRCDISSDGRVAFAPRRDEWYVAVRNTDGTGKCFTRSMKAVKRTDETKKEMWEILGGTDDCKVLETEPVIGRVRWRPNGNLWVEPFGIETYPGAMACFDELSPEGNLLRRIQIVVPQASPDDELLVPEDGRFALLKGFGVEAGANTSNNEAAEVVLLAAD